MNHLLIKRGSQWFLTPGQLSNKACVIRWTSSFSSLAQRGGMIGRVILQTEPYFPRNQQVLYSESCVVSGLRFRRMLVPTGLKLLLRFQ